MSETVYSSKFLGDEKLREHNIFAEEYFTGSDIKLIANGKEIKQISAISYSLQEQLKPIYGYASYTYDDVAVGSRIVTGTFICPVRNLANNPEFKCPPSSNSKTITESNKNTTDNGFKGYMKSFENANLYLDPGFKKEIDKLTKEEVTVKGETETYYYVYLISSNKFGYIKK